MLPQQRRQAAPFGPIQVLDGRVYCPGLELGDRLLRVGHGKNVNPSPKLLQCQDLIEDKGLRQAWIAAEDITDWRIRGRVQHCNLSLPDAADTVSGLGAGCRGHGSREHTYPSAGGPRRLEAQRRHREGRKLTG